MTQEILVLNTGSSSIKFSLFAIGSAPGELTLCCRGAVHGLGERAELVAKDPAGQPLAERPLGEGLSHVKALESLLNWLENEAFRGDLVAAGHRVVHGGDEFAGPIRVSDAVLERLEALTPLAPLHQPHNLSGIRLLGAIRPRLLQVACFDTAFHRTQPPVARSFALPRALTRQGVRRYGFHGLSYEHIATVLPDYLGARADGRVVVAHLGNGASLCGLRAGRSVASTMGFTALDGLPMGTRCGALDPGVVLYLLNAGGMDVAAVTELLYQHSGLLGVSGISGDMRTLLASDAPEADEAIDLFVYRIGRELGSLAAALGGLDALVFTGGIGENAAPIRARVCREAAWLGVRLDEETNVQGQACISAASSTIGVWVIPTDEERVIARHTYVTLLG